MLAVDVALRLGCDVISADSRQIYRDIPIVSAAPTEREMRGVRHHFVGILGLEEYYSAARFEADVMGLLPGLFEKSGGYAVMCGGSMMYVDAVTDGIDDLPDISAGVRNYVGRLLREQGAEALFAQLEVLDPEYAGLVDRMNVKRVAHAVEVSLQAGKPYSELRVGERKKRPFRIMKFAIDMPRAELFDRINRRVGQMVEQGLVEEARRLYPFRHLNSLNTVGLKELFSHFDGTLDLQTALERIGKNTRVYAKKQLTWLGRPSVRPAQMIMPEGAVETILSKLKND